MFDRGWFFNLVEFKKYKFTMKNKRKTSNIHCKIEKQNIIEVEMEGKHMLCQFSVKNNKSIRDEVTFDM